ncbi:O-methyltransferase [Arthrobacter sp.]|uniref:O-methyltransferase n=1 Tax=Arthrobacter sp. TaxID=1667 RepID=UPI003A8CCAB0
MGAEPGQVDDYLRANVVDEPRAYADGRAAAHAAGLPQIEVSAGQGKLLKLLVVLSGARRVLEIGTLGGYSTSWLADGVGPDGHVTTCEFEQRHADVARSNLDAAGLGDRVDIRLGAARDTLAALRREDAEPFDLVFIDADKENNPHYVLESLELTRSGSIIIVDNVVRSGSVLHPGDASTDEGRATNGTREVLDILGSDPRLEATALQTTGSKGWDGFALAVVR